MEGTFFEADTKVHGAMRMVRLFYKQSRTFNLGAVDIDNASEWMVERLAEIGFEKSDRTRARLLFEEALLNMADHHGEDHEVTANVELWAGSYRIRIVTGGDRYNPLRPYTENIEDDWASLFSSINIPIQYAYSAKSNVVRISLPRKTWNPVLKVIIGILCGVVVGVAGNILIPRETLGMLTETILNPIGDMWVRLLQTISAPVIFLAALTATFGTKHIADFGGSRLVTLVRYFAISTVVTIFTMALAWPVFSLDVATTEADSKVVSSALDTILKIIPDNLVEPFSTANTLQLLLVAIVMGYLLAAMESQLKELNTLFRQLNVLGLALAKAAGQLVPVFVGILLCLKIWTQDIAMLGSIWEPFVLATAIAAIVLAIMILATSARHHVNPLLLALKLKDPFIAALKRGTLDFSSVGSLSDSCKQLLGISASFGQAVLPQGLFLYMPISAVGICVFVLFAAKGQQVAVDQVWILAALVLSVVMSVATPPLTGANLLSFVMVFSYLGISNSAILDVMVFDILFGVICIACDQAMLQIETISQAKRMGFLDEKALRAPL